MNIILQALEKKVRYQTRQGMISLEDLFQIPLTELNAILVKLHQEKQDREISFLDEPSDQDQSLNVNYEAALAVMKHRKEVNKKKTEARQIRQAQTMLAELAEQKQGSNLAELSAAELEAVSKLVSETQDTSILKLSADQIRELLKGEQPSA